MQLILETDSGIQYDMEVEHHYHSLEYFNEFVETYLGIPISMQTLSFNGKILRHDDDLINNIILDGSRIHLHIAPTSPNWSHEIFLKMPPPFGTFTIDMDLTQTIQQLEVNIRELMAAETTDPDPDPDPLIIVIKHRNGVELPDHATLFECQMALYPEVTVEFLRPPPERESPSIGRTSDMKNMERKCHISFSSD